MSFSQSRPFRVLAAASLALMAACNNATPSEAAAAKANGGTAAATPAGKDWSKVISTSPQGGIVIGNPDAPVTLMEYGSFTCSHCAEFEEAGMPSLLRNYVAPGKVRFEFRSFPLSGAVDVGMTLLTMCQTPEAGWTFAKALFQSQVQLIQGFQAIPQTELARLQAMPPAEAIVTYADLGGLDDFARVRGVPKARFQQCLSNQGNLAKFEANAAEAQERYKLTGTPWFIINGAAVPNTSNWLSLESKLKAALP